MKVNWRQLGIAPVCFFVLIGVARSAEVSNPLTLKELIAKAKASNHVVTLIHEDVLPEVVRAKEKAFKKRFGFSARLQYQPGHHRDIPPKIMAAAKEGHGVVDIYNGGTPLVLGMFRNGNLRMPPWKAIYQGWPLAKKLREKVPNYPGGPHGTVLSDYCMQQGYTAWTIAYSPLRVQKSALKGFRLQDLTTKKWRDRVVWDARALALYDLPFAPGWNVERMRVLAHNIGANGATLVSGGTAGVIRTILSGGADIGVASMVPVVQRKATGAPIDIAFAKFLIGNLTVTCLVSPGVNDPSMAALYWAWNNFDGLYTEAKLTGGGIIRFVKGEEKHFPLVRLAVKHGIRSGKQVVGPRTEAQAKMAGKNRKIAIKALQAGVRSKRMITQ